MRLRHKKRKMMKIEKTEIPSPEESELMEDGETEPEPSTSELSESVEVEKTRVKICRLCLVFIDEHFVPLNNIFAMLQIVLPEVDPKITKEPVVCQMCFEFLEKTSTFMINSLNVEQKIKNYYEEIKSEISEEPQIDLFNVLEFAFPKLEMDNEGNENHNDTENSEFAPTDLLELNQPKSQVSEDKKPLTKLQVRADSDGITFYSCPLCTFTTKYKYSIKLHKNMMHRDPDEIIMYSCAMCTFKTKHKRYLETHMLVHRDPDDCEMHQCDVCDFKTKFKSYMKTHMLIHKSPDEIKMHKCDYCSFQTKHKKYLETHVLIHMNPNDIPMHHCSICDFQTKSKPYLKTHMLTHKNPGEIPMHKCNECSFQTKFKYYPPSTC
ncbi:hypothetical protein JTB14_018554 [Gonioctena quinquepunctata]|nr:hypothetical protein JTB14_018554 [Gonioctena quinquepunctata]